MNTWIFSFTAAVFLVAGSQLEAKLITYEVSRSVAFETVELGPTPDSAHFNDSHASSAALPASSVGAAISASAEAANVKEVDTELSRALAFAQWPLVFSATMGAVLAGSRRRSPSKAVQLPPRRNRQVTAP